MPPSHFSETSAAAVARRLVLEAATGEVWEALAADGVPSIVLKGPAVARWLYEDEPTRSYVDIDLLVAPDRFAEAGATLRRLGFRRAHASEHADVWARGADGVVVDLHSYLVGAPRGPDAWEVLAGLTERMEVGGRSVDVLDRSARALHVVLHAAQHGLREERSLGDLERALERLPPALWDEVAALAARLGAEGALATGLRLVARGREEAERLGLPSQRTAEQALRAATAPPTALGLQRFVRTPGVRAKARLLIEELAPSPSFMRAWSPLARRGPAGLGVAYVWRPVWLAWRLGPALRAWQRARRAAR
jgi:hypothetical protein